LRFFYALSIVVLTYGIWGCTGSGNPPAAPVQTDTPVTTSQEPTTPAAVQSSTTSDSSILDEYEAELTDAAGDVAKGGAPTHDLVAAYAVATERSVLVRIQSSEPMAVSSRTDVRFWIEQGEKQITVEAKPDHPERICELTPIGETEGEEIPDCLTLGKTLDVKIPVQRLPAWLSTDKEYFISGVSTCCTDDARTVPYDEIEGAQQVWIVPAAGADETETEVDAASPAP